MSQKRGDGWIARWRQPDGAERSKTFPSKLAADAHERKMKAAIDEGRYVDPRAGAVKVREYAESWLATKHEIRAGTRRQYQANLKNHIYPAMGNQSLNRITPADCRKLVADVIAGGASPATVRAVLAPLRQVLAQAVEDQLIVRSPLGKVSLPKPSHTEMIVASPAEIAALDKAAGRDGLLITFLAYTGLRWGEMAGLDISHVDLLRGEVRVVRQLTQAMEFGPTKTGRPRTVPVEAALLERLRTHMAGRPATDPLFTSERGYRLRGSKWNRMVWQPAKKAAKVDSAMRPHDLRHTAATWICQLVDIKTAADFLGHTSTSVTDRYVHGAPERLKAAAAKLGEFRQIDVAPAIASVDSIG